MSEWRAIVFDLDDTLYPERDYVFSGFQAVALWADDHLGIPTEQGVAELRHLFERGARGDTFNRWLAKYNLTNEDLVHRMVDVYREHHPVLTPFPEVPDLLTLLQRHYYLGLVSDGYLSVQQRKLTALGLSHYFDAIVFSDEWGRAAWKPNVRPFETILQRLTVEATKSIYVGDNPTKDFFGARQIGMFTVWVQWSGGEYIELSPPTAQHAPHLIVTSVKELEHFVSDKD
jgi:putative hydrolase of the HAD superfamily